MAVDFAANDGDVADADTDANDDAGVTDVDADGFFHDVNFILQHSSRLLQPSHLR